MTETAKRPPLKRRVQTQASMPGNTASEKAEQTMDPGIAPMVARDTSLLVMSIKASSRDKLTGLLSVTLGLLVLTIVSLSWLKTDHYFAVDVNGRAIEIRPLDSPTDVAGAPVGFINRTLPDVFTFGFINYKDHLYDVRSKYFTELGGNQLIAALNQINLEDFMDAEYSLKLLVHGAGPRLLSEGKNDKGYFYVVQTEVNVILDPPGRENRPRVNEWVIQTVFYVANDNEAGFRIDQFLVQAR
ncbi:DotI/IcmL/TraM family protein [Reinekea sp. G2M2-21]|uniref:DotI/IcmL/TraM family protein n=1 Tax=Reinekea sp. G2M2-21 TaxID=2788942 RepID=UPI0018A8DFFD|nr:DotI/IcmL/TraM family protein [Reinekea sp. G2M2-21]